MKTLRYFFVAALAMMVGNVTAEETIDFTAQGYENAQEVPTFTGTNVTITWAKNDASNAPKWYNTGTAVRLYAKNTVTFTATKTIKVIKFTLAADGLINENNNGFDSGTYDAENTKWEGSASTVVLNNKATSGNQIRIQKLTFYFEGDVIPGDVHIANTEETAYTVAKAYELIDAGEALSETVFVKGVISQIDKFNETYGSITYWISDDGTTAKQLECYSGLNIGGEKFASIEDVAVGANVIVKGTLTKYIPSSGDPIYEFNMNNQLVKYEAAAPATETVWDFTVLPTQTIDGTGNMETNAAGGVFTEDEGAGWQQAYNKADFPDATEFMATATDVFTPFKGLKWTAMGNNKMVFYRNYPAAYGGKHMAFNKEAEFMLPAKVGQVIELVVASSKSGGTTKKITSQDVEEVFDETEHGLKIEFPDPYVYKTVTMTVKTADPYLKFESTFCIQKITVKDATGIAAVKTAKKVADNQMFNLAGQRIAEPAKGQIYIMNGKKYIAK